MKAIAVYPGKPDSVHLAERRLLDQHRRFVLTAIFPTLLDELCHESRPTGLMALWG